MRKHKWRRRLIVLIVLFLVGMTVLKSGEKAQRHTADTASAGAEGGAAEDTSDYVSDNMGAALVASVHNAGEDEKGEETIVGWMIDAIAAGEVDLADEDSIRQALKEAEKESDISLTEENKERIVGFLQTLGTIGAETDDFIDQAKEKYRKYSAQFVEETNEAVNEAVENAVTDAAHNFFDSIRQAAGDFFGNLMPE